MLSEKLLNILEQYEVNLSIEAMIKILAYLAYPNEMSRILIFQYLDICWNKLKEQKNAEKM